MTIFGNSSSSGPMWDLDRPLKQAFSSIQGILPDAEFSPNFASVFKDYSKVRRKTRILLNSNAEDSEIPTTHMSQASKSKILLEILLFEAKVTSALLSIQLETTHIMETERWEKRESKDLTKLLGDILQTIIQAFTELRETMTNGHWNELQAQIHSAEKEVILRKDDLQAQIHPPETQLISRKDDFQAQIHSAEKERKDDLQGQIHSAEKERILRKDIASLSLIREPITLDESLEGRLGIGLRLMKWELRNLERKQDGRREPIAQYWATALTIAWLETLSNDIPVEEAYANLGQVLVDGLSEDACDKLLQDAKNFITKELPEGNTTVD